jgi:hypothetical protein
MPQNKTFGKWRAKNNMPIDDDRGEEAGELLENNTPEEVAEIVEIASGHGLDLEEAVEVNPIKEPANWRG